MLVSVSYEGKEWVVDENTANRFIEFRKVLQDSSLGIQAMAFIALYADPESEFRKAYSDDRDILKQAYATVYETDKTDKIEKNELVQSAFRKYKKLCDTPEARLTESFEVGMAALEKKIKELAKDPDKLNDMLEYMDRAAELRKQYYAATGKKTVEKQKTGKEQSNGRSRSWAESKRG